MRLSTGSIYKAFSDKNAVFRAALEHYSQRRDEQLRPLLGAESTGFGKIRAMLMFYAETSHDIEGRLGCLVASGTTDIATFDAATAAQLTAALQRIEAKVLGLIEQGQADGSIPAELDAATAVRALLCVLEGLRIVGKTGRSRAEMMAVASHALKLLA